MKMLFSILISLMGGIFMPVDSAGQIPTNQMIAYNSPQLQNEEQVFYCPTDSNYILATWRDFRLGYRRCGIGRSTDGGSTWSDHLNALMVDPIDSWQSDPTMTVDAAGNIYCSFLDYKSHLQYVDSSFIIFIKSTDKGATWSGPYEVNVAGPWFEDKQMITIDRTGGAHDGNVYVGWARFPSPTRMMFARSIDGGITFGDTIVVGPTQGTHGCGYEVSAGQFAQPIVGSGGAVYFFWRGYQFTHPTECEGYMALKMSKSLDGGQTWPIIAQPIFGLNWLDWIQGDIDVYNCPAGDADITGGPYDGNIYIATMNESADESSFHGDIIMIKSTDGGATWLPPVMINDDPPGINVDQFHPWLTVNQDGTIVVIFYDRRVNPGNYLFDVFAAYSFDGGETFTSNHRITDVSSSPDNLERNPPAQITDPWEGKYVDDWEGQLASPMAGRIAEYIGVTSFHGAVTAAWTDTRNGNQDVYSATWSIPFLRPRPFLPANGDFAAPDDSMTFSTSWYEDDITYRVEVDDDPLFGSIDVVETPSDNKLYNALLGLADGVYYWRIKAFRISAADSSDYSDIWSFEIETSIPDDVVLVSPEEGLTTRDSLLTFTWAVSRDATEYFEFELSTDPSFSSTPPYFHYDQLETTEFTLPDPIPEDGTYYWHVNHYDLAGNESGYSESASFNFLRIKCGDANGDYTINVGDAVFLINYVFKNGPAPNPLEAGETNCDGAVNVGDAVHLINYVFKNGPAPCAECP